METKYYSIKILTEGLDCQTLNTLLKVLLGNCHKF